MAISYERRDEQRLVVLAVDGPFDAAETAGMLDRLDQEGTISYGVVWDLRRMTKSPTTDELWSFSRDYAHLRDATAEPRGPIAIVTRDEELTERLAFLVNAAGAVPGPMDCYLALRGVKTLALRMEAHCRGARQIAE